MNIVITGALSGLGAALSGTLDRNHQVVGLDKEGDGTRLGFGCDVTQPMDHVAHSCREMFQGAPIDCLINCAGINRINWLEDLAEETWDEVMGVNAKGIFMTTQAFLPQLIETKGTVLNIISNASHMPMTCSLAYNASKGAAYIMTLQLARELTKKYGITVFGISPNKLQSTGMSRDIERQVCETRGWTPAQAEEYQRNALLTGEETDPRELADFIGYLLSSRRRHFFLSGCVIPYGA